MLETEVRVQSVEQVTVELFDPSETAGEISDSVSLVLVLEGAFPAESWLHSDLDIKDACVHCFDITASNNGCHGDDDEYSFCDDDVDVDVDDDDDDDDVGVLIMNRLSFLIVLFASH